MTKDNKNTEQAILEAAEQIFLEKGFKEAKTAQIADKAGVTHAMLHYYYRTKENLFEMVFDRKINLLKESIFMLVQNSDLPFPERLKLGIESHFDFLVANPDLPRFAINEIIHRPQRRAVLEPLIKKMANQLLEQLQTEIDHEVERGTIRPIEAVTLLLDIASLNIFVFAVLPLVRTFAMQTCQNEQEFLELRKRENVEVIMRRLII
ncbi:MAG: TetR/AcrR family transcriptional regulator [Tannerella sp.]|jgi:AcrR family transcriptional regulator|nr:TetR/AcrR family transcriptional regulator [Tannerella sp.]